MIFNSINFRFLFVFNIIPFFILISNFTFNFKFNFKFQQFIANLNLWFITTFDCHFILNLIIVFLYLKLLSHYQNLLIFIIINSPPLNIFH